MAAPKRIEDKSSSDPIIYEGATQGDLSRMFGMTNADVKARISSIRPTGRRNGYDVWKVRDVAPALAKFEADMVERVLKMHPNDIPKMLAKEFWMGQNQRLNYLQRVGDLWDTKAVVDLCGTAFKTLRLSLMLLSDAVERESSLNSAQRDIIDTLITNALEDMREKLVDGLKDRREYSLGKSFAPSQDPDPEPDEDPAAGL